MLAIQLRVHHVLNANAVPKYFHEKFVIAMLPSVDNFNRKGGDIIDVAAKTNRVESY